MADYVTYILLIYTTHKELAAKKKWININSQTAGDLSCFMAEYMTNNVNMFPKRLAIPCFMADYVTNTVNMFNVHHFLQLSPNRYIFQSEAFL